MWIKIVILTFLLSVINGENEEKIDDDMEVFASKVGKKNSTTLYIIGDQQFEWNILK